MTIGQIAEITGAVPHQVPDTGAKVTGTVVIDSREAGPGCLFAALPGERADGHDFAVAAVAAGAAAVLGTRPAGAPALLVRDVPAAMAALARSVVDRLPKLTIAGITGSAGKTTTKDLSAQLIAGLGTTVFPKNSFNNEIGHPLTVLRADEETRYLILELSARGPGHIAALCEIAPPRLGVVLCVGSAHAGMFSGKEMTARAKGELPAALPPDGVALLNADDPLVAAMAERTRARVVTFGRSAGAAVRAEDVTLDELDRPAFTIVTPDGRAPVRLRLHGEHNVINALAAAALAGEVGMSAAEIGAGLSVARPLSRWRMEVTERSDDVIVINDAYNASPEAMIAALRSLEAMARGRRAFAVLGHMAELGDQAARFHELAGVRAAESGLTGLVVVGEQAAPILDGARSVPGFTGELIAVPDAQTALAELRPRLRPGDVVLVKASHAVGLETVGLALAAQEPLT